MSEKQSTQYRGWGIASTAVLILNVGGLIILAKIIMDNKQLLIVLLNRLGAKMPLVTLFLASTPLAFDLLFIGVLILALLVKERCIQRKRTAFAMNLFVLVGLGYLLLYVVSMILPLLQIIEWWWFGESYSS